MTILNLEFQTIPNTACVRTNLYSNEFGTSFYDSKNHVKVKVNNGIEVKYGMCFKLESVNKIINKVHNNSSFDYKQYMLSKKIVYEANAKEKIPNQRSSFNFMQNLRAKIIARNCKEMPKICAYPNAILFGENQIETKYKNIYGQIGIAPLFVISGMHISLIDSFLMFYLSKLQVEYCKANKISLAFLLVYSMLAGATVAINRAIIMKLSKVIFGLNSKESLKIAMVISLLYNPFNIYNNGYILSYLITAIIVYRKEDENWSNLRNNVYISLKCFLFSLPISYKFNYTLNILAPISMLIFTPLICFTLIPVSIVTVVCPNFITKNILYFNIQLINIIATFFDNFSVVSGHISLIMWVLYILLVFYSFKGARRAMVLLVLWFIVMMFNYSLYPKITFIDVGQGDGALISFKNKNYLVDVGDKATEIVKELKYQGVNQIDGIFISHAHVDHYGALLEIAENFKVKNVYELAGNQIIKNSIGVSDTYKTKNFTIIPYYGSNENDRELVVKFKTKNYSVLFSGDIEKESEEYLTQNFCPELESDVIKVPHHGSDTSSSPELLSCVDPQIAIISSGKNNRYHHPNSQIVESYKEIADVYSTQDVGEVEIVLKTNELKIKTNL